MAIYASDDFAPDNVVDWGDADVGGHWGYVTTPLLYDKSSGFGRVTSTATDIARHAFLYEATDRDNVKASVKVKISTNTCVLYLWVRVNSLTGTPDGIGNETGYTGIVLFQSDNQVDVSITKFSAGSESDPDSGAAGVADIGTYTTDQDWWIELIVEGTSLELRVWKDGEERPSVPSTSATDNDHATGKFGLGLYNSGGDAKTISYSDFTVVDLAAAHSVNQVHQSLLRVSN